MDLNFQLTFLPNLRLPGTKCEQENNIITCCFNVIVINNYSFRTDLKDASQRVEAAQRQLRDLQGSRQNKLKLFGAWQPELRQKIEQAVQQGRFHHAPVGPIGMVMVFSMH